MMEHFFIKDIIDKNLFNNTPEVIYDNIFNYYDNKENIIEFHKINNDNLDNDEFEVIDIEKEKSQDIINYISEINNEKARILKVLEFLIVNIDINKLELPDYKKTANYDNTPNYLKNKIKKHINNNPFDIKKFLTKNEINKNHIINKISIMTSINENEFKDKSDFKFAIYFILINIINIFNCYYKCLNYSIDLLNKQPEIFNNNNKFDYICYIINFQELFKINNNDIIFNHFGIIKNAFPKDSKDKLINTIIFSKTPDKNYKISFK
jgi:hypothetical protein